jgi:hypothetical protein
LQEYFIIPHISVALQGSHKADHSTSSPQDVRQAPCSNAIHFPLHARFFALKTVVVATNFLFSFSKPSFLGPLLTRNVSIPNEKLLSGLGIDITFGEDFCTAQFPTEIQWNCRSQAPTAPQARQVHFFRVGPPSTLRVRASGRAKLEGFHF